MVTTNANSKIAQVLSEQDTMVKKIKRRQYYLQKRNKDLMEQMSGNNLTFFVNNILNGMHFEKYAALVLDMVVSGEMFGEAGKDATKELVKREVHKVFTACCLCKAKVLLACILIALIFT